MTQRECCILKGLTTQLEKCQESLAECQSLLLETEAWEQWDLKAGPASLTGLINSRPLTPPAPGPLAPSWNATNIILSPNVGMTGLNTGFAETPNLTICAVIKRFSVVGTPAPTGQNPIIASGSTQNAAPSGMVIMLATFVGDGLTFTCPCGGSCAGYAIPASSSIGDWLFVVLRNNIDVPGTYIGGGGAIVDSGPMAARGGNFFIGSGYNAGEASPIECAEVIIFNKSLNQDQINQVYGRSIARMAAKGIDITPPPSAITLISSTSKGTSITGGTTDPINTDSAKLLVANLNYYNSGTLSSFIDNFGNSWIPLTPSIDVVSGVVQQLFYAENPITGPGHTFSVNGASIYASIQVAAFSGVTAIAALDEESGIVGSGSSISIGPVNQSTPVALVIAGAGFSDSTPGPISGDAGFSVVGFTNYSFGNYFGGSLAFKVSSSIVPHIVNLDLAAPMSGISASIATFKS